MRIDKIQLLNTIYKYFPKGLTFSQIEYDNSRETMLKLSVINKTKGDASVLFSTLFNRLKEKNSKNISDQSPLLDKEFCNYLRYDIKAGNFTFRFHILLSFLEPFHCILITCYAKNYQKLFFTGDYEDIKTKDFFSTDEEEIVLSHAKSIDDKVSAIFKTSNVKMSELLDIIPDIETGHKELGEVTFFDCLFTPYLQFF